MFPRDLKLYLFLVCVPAVLLTGVGLVQLHKIAEGRQAAAAVARAGVLDRVQSRLRELVFDEEKGVDARTPAACCEELVSVFAQESDVRAPQGAFLWKPRTALVSAGALPDAVKDEIAAFKVMGDWGESPKNSKKPPMAGVRLCADQPVVWVRDGKRNGSVCGLVFAEDPVRVDFFTRALWPVGLVLGLLLVGVLGAGAVLLVRAVVQARRDDRMKTTFLANAAHELKTPLAGIGVWVELLKGGRLPSAKQAHAYDIISAENARMVRLVENLLDFSRLEQGRRRYHFRAVDLGALADTVAELVRGDFAAHGLAVTQTGAVRAWADRDAAQQILVNLLGNAAKYAAAAGPVDVTVARAGARVQVAVADRGPGMSEEARAHAFERFWRAETELTSETGGLGLGLAISDALAKDMDGRLAVTAREGGGCVFTLDLPAAAE